MLSGILSAILAAFAAPVAARRMGKKHAAMAFAVLAGFSYPMPVVLRLFGMMPANGTDALIWVLVAFNVWAIALIISAATLVSAMMADIVEESELDTGRRSEGIFFAARSFISKSLTGLGIVFSAAVLEMIDFPAQARPSELDPDIIWRLGAGYAPLLLGLFLISMVCLSTYQLTREQHEANVAELEERARRI